MKKVTTKLLAIFGSVAMLGASGVSGVPGRAMSRPATSLTNDRTRELAADMKRLLPLARRLSKPKPGEWLYQVTEQGQTFSEYIAANPVIPSKARRTVYIQPLGRFASIQRQVVSKVAKFLGLYYGLDVKVLDSLGLSLIPAGARRIHPEWENMQLKTGYILDKLLLPRMPKDAFAYVALTTTDLWPGEEWNYVFGSASPRHRVGVLSLHRYGNPAAGEKEYRLCLLRTLKTAAHETGHMFSMPHCPSYRCIMNGSNGISEADRKPIALCPQCLAKVCWATRCRPAARYRKLIDFYHANGLGHQEASCRLALRALSCNTVATSPAK